MIGQSDTPDYPSSAAFFHNSPKRIFICKQKTIAEKYRDFPKAKILGEGSYGQVYLFGNAAIKKTTSFGPGVQESTLREVALMRDLRHVNVMRLENVFRFQSDRENIYMEMKIAREDFACFIRKSKDILTHEDVQFFSFQLLQGLEYCHSIQLIHRDLKPANLLLFSHPDYPNDETKSILKIADWGMCRQVSVPAKSYTPEIQTLLYRAPEVLLGQEYYFTEVDIWSAGLIILEMFTKRPFFNADTEASLIHEWRRKLGLPPAELYPKSPFNLQTNSKRKLTNFSIYLEKMPGGYLELSAKCNMLLLNMLHWDVLKRFSAKQCLKDPYFQPMYTNPAILKIYRELGQTEGGSDRWDANCAKNEGGSFGDKISRNLPTPPVDDNEMMIDKENSHPPIFPKRFPSANFPSPKEENRCYY